MFTTDGLMRSAMSAKWTTPRGTRSAGRAVDGTAGRVAATRATPGGGCSDPAVLKPVKNAIVPVRVIVTTA
jgi:hypothetical protein